MLSTIGKNLVQANVLKKKSAGKPLSELILSLLLGKDFSRIYSTKVKMNVLALHS